MVSVSLAALGVVFDLVARRLSVLVGGDSDIEEPYVEETSAGEPPIGE